MIKEQQINGSMFCYAMWLALDVVTQVDQSRSALKKNHWESFNMNTFDFAY